MFPKARLIAELSRTHIIGIYSYNTKETRDENYGSLPREG